VSGRPTFTEMKGLSLADDTGGGRPDAVIRVPATFNADPYRARPLVIVSASKGIAVTTMESTWGLTNLATTMDAIVLLVSGTTDPSIGGQINAWNGNLCCC